MKIDISKRDIRVFVLGLLTTVVIDFVWNWNQNIQDMKDGFNEGYNDARTESGN